MGKCQEILKLTKIGCVVFAVQVTSLLITNRCALAKVVATGGWNSSDGLSTTENVVGNKAYDNLYDYYDEAFQEYSEQRVIDLDEYYEIDGKSSLVTDQDVDQNYYGDFEKNLHVLRTRAKGFNLRCPDLPSYYPIEPKHSLCFAKTCRSDEDCAVITKRSSTPIEQRYICCFNGCVPSCLPKLDPPKAFDWIEESGPPSLELNIRRSNGNAEMLKALPVHDESTGQIYLPGGCVITQQQLQEIHMFRKYDHFEMCTCTNSEILCHVKVRNPST